MIVTFLAAGLAWCPSGRAEEAGPPPAAAPEMASEPAPSADEAQPPKEPTAEEAEAAAQLEKQIASLRDQMMRLQKDEFRVTADTAKKEMAAKQEGIKPAAARAWYVSAISDWRGMNAKFGRVMSAAEKLDRERDKAPKNLQAQIDLWVNRVYQKQTDLVERLVGLYQKAGDPKSAAAAYAALLDQIPDHRKENPRAMKERLAVLLAAAGNYPAALAQYTEILKSLPEKQQKEDIGLQMKERMADLMAAAGNYKAALAQYTEILKSLPEKQQKEDFGLQWKIGGMYEKMGDAKTAVQIKGPIFEKRLPPDQWIFGANMYDVFNMGGLYEKVGQWQKAMDIYTKFRKLLEENKNRYPWVPTWFPQTDAAIARVKPRLEAKK
jgi:tetratricopeptide (TPR) repeat protein